jgi:hypothetical protein
MVLRNLLCVCVCIKVLRKEKKTADGGFMRGTLRILGVHGTRVSWAHGTLSVRVCMVLRNPGSTVPLDARILSVPHGTCVSCESYGSSVTS